MKQIVIFGLGEYAEVARLHFGPRCLGFTVNNHYKTFDHMGLPVFSWETLFPSQPLFIAVGNNRERQRIYAEANERKFELADLVLSDTRHAEYGRHCCILELNNIQPCVEIGDNTVIWSGNHIGHHSKIGRHCFITSHVVISGGVEIGDGTFIGVNAAISDHVRIGAGCVIQAGSFVDKSIPDDCVWTREGLSKVPAHRLKI